MKFTTLLTVALVLLMSITGLVSATAPTPQTKIELQTDLIGMAEIDFSQQADYVMHTGNIGAIMKVSLDFGTMTSQVTSGSKTVVSVHPYGVMDYFRIDGITALEYDTQIGIKTTSDGYGMDEYTIDGIRYESETTGLDTISYSGPSLAWAKPSTSSWKAWYTGPTYGDLDESTTGYILTLQIQRFKGSTPYETHTVSVPFRCPMDTVNPSRHDCEGEVDVYMPLKALPRLETIKVGMILTSIKYVFEYISIQAVTHTWWSFPVLNQVFGTSLQVASTTQIEALDEVNVIRQRLDVFGEGRQFTVI